MICLILGTSEGKKILSLMNEYTEDILVSTATAYGGEILCDYKYSFLNTKPLDLDGLVAMLKKYNVNLLVDASHPYALEITKNAKEACKLLSIVYLRYERPSVLEEYGNNEKITSIKNINELKEKILKLNIKGCILNTTGSRGLDKLLALKLDNRIVHRVLPSIEVMERCLSLSIKVEDIIAIKGPIGYALNVGFIKEYGAEAMILKDSGIQGGTKEKLNAAIDSGVYAFVLERNAVDNKKVIHSEIEIAQEVRKYFN